MQSLQFDDLKKLERDLQQLIDGQPQRRRKLHQQVANALKAEVDRQIDRCVEDGQGKVKNWQELDVGSGGGYAVVRAKKGEHKRYRIGYIVNALENGHDIRRPSGRWKGYYPRNEHDYVPGRKFYSAAQRNAEKIALEAANRWADEIAKALGG